jgi:ribonuclease HI
MGKVRKRHAQEYDGDLPTRRKKQKLFSTASLVRKLRNHETKSGSKERRIRMRDSVLGPNRSLAATVRIDQLEAYKTDFDRLRGIDEDILAGRAIVYWVDGSMGGGGFKRGVVGAGVVWHTGQHEYTCVYKLGRWTGNSGDAEVFGIAAALGRAKKKMEEGEKYELVRVYSDAVHILKDLAKDGGSMLGPLLAQTTAIEALFERAEWLRERGVKVELIWVKGHKKSKANKLADKTATKAVEEGALESYDQLTVRKWMTRADVPAWCSEMGPDWIDEWLFRANRDLKYGKPALLTHAPTVDDDLDDPLEQFGATPMPDDTSEVRHQDAGVKPRPTLILKWKQTPDPVQQYAPRYVWDADTDEAGESMGQHNMTKSRFGVRPDEKHEPTRYFEGVKRLQAAMEERDVGLKDADRETFPMSPPEFDPENIIPITEPRYSLRSDITRPGDGSTPQPVPHALPSNLSIDQAITHLRQGIKDRNSELADLQQRTRIERNKVLGAQLAGELRVLQERQVNAEIELDEKLAERAAPATRTVDVSEQLTARAEFPPYVRPCSHIDSINHIPQDEFGRNTLLRQPAGNHSSIADLRQPIEDLFNEIADVQKSLITRSSADRLVLHSKLGGLDERLYKARDALWAKTAEREGGKDGAAQGSQLNPFTVDSSPEPEPKNKGTRANPVEIASSPEPEAREVRWVGDDLLDALELEAQWHREGFRGVVF